MNFNPKQKFSLKRYCSICRKPVNQNIDIHYRPILCVDGGARWLACSYEHACQMSADFMKVERGVA